MRAYTRIHTFQGRSTFLTWLLSIARRAVADYYRTRANERIVDSPTCLYRGHAAFNSTPDSVHKCWEARRHIEHCLGCIMQSLPVEQQMTLILCEFYSFSDAEISHLIGRTLSTCKHLLHNGRQTMEHISNGNCAVVKKTGELSKCEPPNTIAPNVIPHSSKDLPQESILSLRTKLLHDVVLLLDAKSGISPPFLEAARQDNRENTATKFNPK